MQCEEVRKVAAQLEIVLTPAPPQPTAEGVRRCSVPKEKSDRRRQVSDWLLRHVRELVARAELIQRMQRELVHHCDELV